MADTGSSIVPAFTIVVDGVEHLVKPRQADIARVEAMHKTSISRLSEQSEFGLLLSFAYVALRRLNVDVGKDFDAFLDLDPEIDLASMQEHQAGKGSDPAAITG